MAERRKAHSTFKDRSLEQWLAAVAARNEIRALTVADDHGLLVASCLAAAEAERMAAAAARHAARGAECTVADDEGMTIVIQSFSWEGERLLVCAKGDEAHSRAALGEALAGIHRILEDG
jgi:predicted regulator of Ras-like GTPase activity (Roadblock/LC7/MglB family)